MHGSEFELNGSLEQLPRVEHARCHFCSSLIDRQKLQLGTPTICTVWEEKQVARRVAWAVGDEDILEDFVSDYVKDSSASYHDVTSRYFSIPASSNDSSYFCVCWTSVTTALDIGGLLVCLDDLVRQLVRVLCYCPLPQTPDGMNINVHFVEHRSEM